MGGSLGVHCFPPIAVWRRSTTTTTTAIRTTYSRHKTTRISSTSSSVLVLDTGGQNPSLPQERWKAPSPVKSHQQHLPPPPQETAVPWPWRSRGFLEVHYGFAKLQTLKAQLQTCAKPSPMRHFDSLMSCKITPLAKGLLAHSLGSAIPSVPLVEHLLWWAPGCPLLHLILFRH